jgi:ADP-ribose pyrophosphatase YjhB (NUDIX family)
VNQIQGKDPRILLLQRGLMAPTYPGYWGGPGGIQGAGESLEEVAARETLEESSIVFEPTSLFYQGELPDRKVFYFLGRWYAPERIVIQQDEAIGFGWFTFQEALRLSLSLRYREAITQLAMQFS